METNNGNIGPGMAPARYLADFNFIPSIFYGDPNRFLDMVLHDGPIGFATAFNLVYDDFNKTVFTDNPKVFKDEDFKVDIDNSLGDVLIITVSNPHEHEGSLVYCKNYFFLYFAGKPVVMYLTLEDGGIGDFVCGVAPQGERFNYGMVKSFDEAKDIVMKVIESVKSRSN